MAATNRSSNSPERRTYSVSDITQILGIGRSSAYTFVKQGKFKTVKIGSAIRISKKSFDEWLEGQDNQDKGENP